MDEQLRDSVGGRGVRCGGSEAQPEQRQDLPNRSVPAAAPPDADGRVEAPSDVPRVLEGAGSEILHEIRSPDCAVAIWRRDALKPQLAEIEALPPDQLPQARFVSRADGVGRMLAQLFEEQRIADTAARKFLAEDVAALAAVFARAMKTAMVRVRLDVISDDACRKFHLDNVAARLLCTYRGRGTQYGRIRVDADPRAQKDPSPIHELAPGSVGLFRGGLWPAAKTSAVVHRSPPIAGLGETRLLLVIDEGAADADCM